MTSARRYAAGPIDEIKRFWGEATRAASLRVPAWLRNRFLAQPLEGDAAQDAAQSAAREGVDDKMMAASR